MKKQIQSYLVGVLNNHKRVIVSMKDYGYSKASIQSHQNYTNELNDLYDFISILPDEQIPDTYKEINRLRAILERNVYESEQQVFSIIAYKKKITNLEESIHNHYRGSEKIVIENVALKKRVAELEESCQNMNEVEKNLHRKINAVDSNRTWIRRELVDRDKTLKEVELVNLGVWEDNRRLKLLNKCSFRKIKILKNKLKTKLKGDC